MIDVIQEAPRTVFLTEDEASLYLQATSSMVWAPRGQTPVVRADPGRAKVNFYGTLNLYTGRVMITRATEMKAETTAQHLEQILSAIPEVPIVLFWDRAPWHSGPAVRDVLRQSLAQANLQPQIILLYAAPLCPHFLEFVQRGEFCQVLLVRDGGHLMLLPSGPLQRPAR